MSMIGNLAAATDEEIATLLAEPEGIEDFLYRDEDDEDVEEDDEEDRRTIDVDKAWHAMHFLLNGRAWDGVPPLDFWCTGGTSIGDVDVGYGPARAFSATEVRAIADALAPIDVATLFSRWDSAAIRAAEIYAVDPDRREEEEGYVGGYFEGVKAFIGKLAAAGRGMIVFIN